MNLFIQVTKIQRSLVLQDALSRVKARSASFQVIVDSLPGNNKNRESTRSWTERVRLVIFLGGVS